MTCVDTRLALYLVCVISTKYERVVVSMRAYIFTVLVIISSYILRASARHAARSVSYIQTVQETKRRDCNFTIFRQAFSKKRGF